MSATRTLKDRTLFITGASRGIGLAIAKRAAADGANIAIAAKTVDENPKLPGTIHTAAAEIEAAGGKALPIQCDIRDEASVLAAVAQTVERFGGIDILVNNAGATRGSDRVPIVELPAEEWHRVLGTNVHGTFYMSQACARRMLVQGRGGSIVNISSLVAKLLPAGAGAYAASKAAVNALSTVMAAELGPQGIRVNAICPGIIDTSRLDDLGRGEAWSELLRAHVSLGRAGTGEDIANLVAFLCSDQGAWITGQHISIDGGHNVTPHRPR